MTNWRNPFIAFVRFHQLEVGELNLRTTPIDEFLPARERNSLHTALNTLLASPTFESWRTGASLDVSEWVARREDGRTPATIISVAHLDDDERELVLGIVLDQLLAWMRTQAGTRHLRSWCSTRPMGSCRRIRRIRRRRSR